VRADIVPGTTFPDHQLTDHTRTRRRLSELQDADPMTNSTDNIVATRELRTRVGANWTFLSDPGRKVQEDLGIPGYTDPHRGLGGRRPLTLLPRRRPRSRTAEAVAARDGARNTRGRIGQG
jgi:hypothetical protein